jgi:hypothetical protein
MKALPDKGSRSDDEVERIIVDRVAAHVGKSSEAVAEVVRDELSKRRGEARIQTFVPILVERAARARLTA